MLGQDEVRGNSDGGPKVKHVQFSTDQKLENFTDSRLWGLMMPVLDLLVDGLLEEEHVKVYWAQIADVVRLLLILPLGLSYMLSNKHSLDLLVDIEHVYSSLRSCLLFWMSDCFCEKF
eukprot:TRINITY_DN85_c1_g2_i2.p3 TRINITY_DN85_c1_g2~~TRINITY_DN85_c1_g2_i2.p3  ORF type:complete len:118 (-),score=9.68 TRINITY_DN85_c1_g2_i2:891-1244(-)